jgi:hypothetical protein
MNIPFDTNEQEELYNDKIIRKCNTCNLNKNCYFCYNCLITICKKCCRSTIKYSFVECEKGDLCNICWNEISILKNNIYYNKYTNEVLRTNYLNFLK